MTDNIKTIAGHIADIKNQRFIDGELQIKNGNIVSIVRKNDIAINAPYIIPGFIDSHVHIESSMLLPSHYVDSAIKHGVIGCVCDPHEIANVCGQQGVDFMINESKQRHFHFAFTVPSCVPATEYETSGYVLDSTITEQLLKRQETFALAEMMNFPGVIADDPKVMQKIHLAQKEGKPIDGHAPMLSGEGLEKYIQAGISTDHECNDINEAEEKIRKGMKILIREGSAAKNFDTLYPLIDRYPDKIMFCSDDIHPDELLKGYINRMVIRSINNGLSFWNVLKAACVNPVIHYKLPIGLLKEKDSADFIAVDNFDDMNVLDVYIKGHCVYSKQEQYACNQTYNTSKAELPNNFHARKITQSDITVQPRAGKIKVIGAKDKELFTEALIKEPKIKDGNIVSDTENDVLKIAVCNRYEVKPLSVAFINGFGLKQGALASSIAHDSHNIIALGTSDELITNAINCIIDNKGGICAVDNSETTVMRLPFGGLMSDDTAENVARQYKRLNEHAKRMGCVFNAPFMTMAFMALLVIPEIKISDKGLFDVNKFAFTSLFEA